MQRLFGCSAQLAALWTGGRRRGGVGDEHLTHQRADRNTAELSDGRARLVRGSPTVCKVVTPNARWACTVPADGGRPRRRVGFVNRQLTGPTILAIDDAATAALTGQFYRHLRSAGSQADSAAESLHRATRLLRAMPRRAPSRCAPFTHTGP